MTPDTNPGKGGSETAKGSHRLKREVASGTRPKVTLRHADIAQATATGVSELEHLAGTGEELRITPHRDGTTTIARGSVSPIRAKVEVIVARDKGVKTERKKKLSAYKALWRALHSFDEAGAVRRPIPLSQFPDSLVTDEQIGPILGQLAGGKDLSEDDEEILAERATRGLSPSDLDELEGGDYPPSKIRMPWRGDD